MKATLSGPIPRVAVNNIGNSMDGKLTTYLTDAGLTVNFENPTK